MVRPRNTTDREIQETVIGGVPVKLWSIFAHGMASDMPLSIDYGDRPEKKLPDGHVIVVQAWTVGWRLARRVVKRCEALLKKARVPAIDAGYALTPVWADRLITVAAREEGIPLYNELAVAAMKVSRDQLKTEAILRHSEIMGISTPPRS
jgi:hypothetical protein